MEKRIELERRARKANQITELNLDNCRSTSIVGFTDEYTALESLSLINVGLTTLKGFPKLPNLKKLELSDNRISSGLNYLTTSPKLQYLNLSGNKIKDLETLKPLQEFKNLAVLDLFNNDATQVDNYREKIFKMLPSLNFLDGFDCNDEEAQSEGEDDEEVNGNDSEEEDKRNAFCLNGLEIDLDELEELEQRVKAKKSLQERPTAPAVDTDVDELDEYLKELQLRESKAATDHQSVIEADPAASQQPPNRNPNINFAILLYWFLAILNLANATYFSTEDGDSDDTDEDGDNGEVSLSEVYNDDLEEDNSDWEEGEGGGDDDEEDSDIDDADGEANESTASLNASKKEPENNTDESEARGKKRKHDG